MLAVPSAWRDSHRYGARGFGHQVLGQHLEVIHSRGESNSMATPLVPRPLALLTPFLPQSGQINASVQQSVNMAVDMHKSALPHARTVPAKRENVDALSLGGSVGGSRAGFHSASKSQVHREG